MPSSAAVLRRLHNAYSRKRRRLLKEWLAVERVKQGCDDCGERDPIVLDWHHARGRKDFSVGRGVHNMSRAKLQREIDKCIVLCANCHRRRHAK